MSVPKDTHKADRIGSVRLARQLSNIISPPTMFAAAGLALGVRSEPVWPGLGWGALYSAFVAGAPMIAVLLLLRSGHISELHMSATHERHIPYLVAFVAGVAAWGLLTLLDGPELLRCLAIVSAATLGALGVINAFWLISIHATDAAATWLIATLVFGWGAALLLLPAALLICYVRLYLKRHSVAQVVGGLALGLSVVLLMRAFGCFVV